MERYNIVSTPAVFPFFSDCTAASTYLRRMGWSSSVSVWVQFSTDGSPLALWLYSSEQYSVHRSSICRSSVSHFPERSWTEVTFPCFTVVKSFTSSYALLLLFFLRFSSISLHCSPGSEQHLESDRDVYSHPPSSTNFWKGS